VTWAVNDGVDSSAPITTTVDIDELGLDTNARITTLAQAQAIKDAGYQFVATYVGKDRPLMQTEAQLLGKAGLQVVTIYENGFMSDTNPNNGDYTRRWESFFSTALVHGGTQSVAYTNGYNDAKSIYGLLAPSPSNTSVRQPFGSPIYFAIDLDPEVRSAASLSRRR
jgi:hypothetical protein